jgi:c-di-GMP-binding flagellar brake protein YcgR
MMILRNNRNIESGIIEFLKIRSQCIGQDLYHRIRNAPRYKVKKQLNVEIYPEGSNNSPVSLNGYSRDISIGGMGIVLESHSIDGSNNDPSFFDVLNHAKIKICLPVETLSINISGKIVWNQQIMHDGQKTRAVGVQFDEISPKIGGILLSLLNNLEFDH